MISNKKVVNFIIIMSLVVITLITTTIKTLAKGEETPNERLSLEMTVLMSNAMEGKSGNIAQKLINIKQAERKAREDKIRKEKEEADKKRKAEEAAKEKIEQEKIAKTKKAEEQKKQAEKSKSANRSSSSRGASAKLNASDLEILEKIVMAEAGAEPYAGQVAVANVVLNRVSSSRYPNTIRGVVFQKSQFTPAGRGTIWNMKPTQSVKKATSAALSGEMVVGSDTLYFVNPRLATDQTVPRTKTVVKRIGSHTFYK